MNQKITLYSKNASYTLPYNILRSSRRSVSIEIKPGGKLLVRAPRLLSAAKIEEFLLSKGDWIVKHYILQCQVEIPAAETPSPAVLALEKRYRQAAAEYFPKRVAYYLPLTGGTFKKITIRDQKTRWGSCSSNQTLSFNWRLMLAPPIVLDYVVVHELCHLTHMNHSKEFWAAVEQVMPDYKVYRAWLKENGRTLIISL